MSIANHKGGYNKTLRVQQNSSNESICVLRAPFLKKAENYSLQVTDFFINVTPELNQELDEQFRIVAYEDDFPRGFNLTDRVFTPQKCYTVSEYAVQLQEFFQKFSFLFWKYGITGPRGVTPEQIDTFIDPDDFAARPVNFTKHNLVPNLLAVAGNIDEGWVDLPRICSCSLDSDLRLNIRLEPVFLANFFIHCKPHFAKRLGFPTYMFQIYNDTAFAGTVNLLPPETIFQVGPAPEGTYLFMDVVNDREPPPDYTNWRSAYTIRELDDRISIDLVSTFPVSRKISVLDGKETQEYLLARFDLSNYKEFSNVYSQDDERMLGTTEITENFQAGLENLTRGNADYESNMLLSGSINQVHLMLYTRYLEHNEIVRVPTDVTDGFWHTRILFSKKV